MNKYKIVTSHAVAAGILMSLSSANAATVFADARGVGTNGFLDTPPTYRVGQGGSSARFATIVLFSVNDILDDNPSLTVGDLATTQFTLSFDTTNAVLLPNAGFYVADYLGFVANANTAVTSFWTGIRGNGSNGYRELVTGTSTGVADTLAVQTGITSAEFSLTGITESDTSNDYVIFGIGYSVAQPTSTSSNVGNFTLTAIPEPSAALLGGLGLLTLLRRRRA